MSHRLNYAHHLIECIADHHGVSTDIAKRDVKAEWGRIVSHVSVVTGERTARLVSLGDYTNRQLSELISHMEVYCDENNIEYVPSGTPHTSEG